jgi:kynurenine formamidase
MIIPLSHPLTPETPLYPNTPPPMIQPHRALKNGDSANTSSITFTSHSGTHIDVPRHFCRDGKTVSDYFTLNASFYPVYCIDTPKEKQEEIIVSDLENEISRIKDAESILIKTGWHFIRSKNPDQYMTDHPWVSSKVPRFLREQFPYLRLFGLDQISLSSPLHSEEGHECHRQFLCEKKPILVLEDLNLSDIRIKGPFKMHIFPYIIGSFDGTPVTVIAEIP